MIKKDYEQIKIPEGIDKVYLMKESLKFVNSNRKKLKNDRPFLYYILNQDLYINITSVMWIIWQAWVLSSIFLAPSAINEKSNGVSYYFQSSFWKIGVVDNALPQNADQIGLLWRPETYVFGIYTIILLILSTYTIIVSDIFINEIKKVVVLNQNFEWKVKIKFFIVFSHLIIAYGYFMLAWIIVSLFYVPNAKASVGFETLMYKIPSSDNLQSSSILSPNGYALITANSINLLLLISLFIYYLKNRFLGYRYFFAFEKKEWKKIDYVGQTMNASERKKILKANKPHRGKIEAVNNPEKIIELQKVNKYFISNGLKFHALKDVDLAINQGEFVVILGPSGSGKTTLLNIISGVDRPTSGNIVVANHNIINMKNTKLTKFRREKTGYIFQQYSLLPNLTVKENIMIGYYLGQSYNQKLETKKFNKDFKEAKSQDKLKVLKNRIKSVFTLSSQKHKMVEDIISLLGLEQHANKYPSQLSGGQQQRVAIARAFVKRPDILFGDEPTGAIDEEMAKQILELFYLINKMSKTTIVMVTHNPILAEMGTRILEVHNGIITRNYVNPNPKKVSELNWSSH